MDVVTIKGKTETIFDNRSICEIIQRELGFDFAEIVSSKIVDIDAETLYAKERAMTDCDCYEAEIESKNSCLSEIMDLVEKFQCDIEDKKRVPRRDFEEVLENILKTINNYM